MNPKESSSFLRKRTPNLPPPAFAARKVGLYVRRCGANASRSGLQATLLAARALG